MVLCSMMKALMMIGAREKERERELYMVKSSFEWLLRVNPCVRLLEVGVYEDWR